MDTIKIRKTSDSIMLRWFVKMSWSFESFNGKSKYEIYDTENGFLFRKIYPKYGAYYSASEKGVEKISSYIIDEGTYLGVSQIVNRCGYSASYTWTCLMVLRAYGLIDCLYKGRELLVRWGNA